VTLKRAEFLDSLPKETYKEYVNLKDAAHMIAGDSNEVFSEAVWEFLARLNKTTPA